MRNKKIIALMMSTVILVTSMSTNVVNANENGKKELVVQTVKQAEIQKTNLSEDLGGVQLDTKDYVQDLDSDQNSIQNGNSKQFKIQKETHEKTVEKRSSQGASTEWNMQQIKADTNLSKMKKDNHNSKIKVAILDSGVDYSTDFEVFKRKNFIPGEDDVSIVYDDICGHGTMVAGIIAAKDNGEGITGINENVELYSAKILDAKLQAPISRVVEAIRWAIEEDVNIINISFGTQTDSPLLRQAIKDAYDAGILIIAAAGNDGIIEYPAAYEEVIAVGSVDTQGEICDGSASGDELELVAPGEQILSTGAFDGIMVGSGTSMAAPHVTGIASVLWQQDTSASSDFIRQLMDYSANQYGEREDYGYGLVDLNFALDCYSEFQNIYNKKTSLDTAIKEAEKENKLMKNATNVVTFDDVDYVEGLWSKEDHQSLASQGTMTGTDLEVLKLGARANDDCIGGMTTYPQFHGYYCKNPDGVYQYSSNYVASYIWLTKCALGFSTNDTINTWSHTQPGQLSYQTQNDYNDISGKITASYVYRTGWEGVLGNYSVTDYKKRLIVYGMALHAATDVFAHSTYISKTVSEGTYISHDNYNAFADYHGETYQLPNRYTCATKIAGLIVEKARTGQQGSALEFCIPTNSVYNGTFYVRNYSSNIQTVDPSYYSVFSSYIQAINCTK